jgi:hypothetical protein
MKELARQAGYESPSYTASYGNAKYLTENWDYDVIYGCLCDSSWEVL